MKKSKFGGTYPLDVKKLSVEFPEFHIDDIASMYWESGRDVEIVRNQLIQSLNEQQEEQEVYVDPWEGYSEKDIAAGYAQTYEPLTDDEIKDLLRCGVRNGHMTEEEYEEEIKKILKKEQE